MAKKINLELEHENVLKIVAEVKAQRKSLAKTLSDAKAEIKKIQGNSQAAEEIRHNMSSISVAIKQSETKINTDSNRVIKLLTDAETFYNKKYLPLSKEINDGKTGFAVKIKTAKTESNELSKIKKEGASKLLIIRGLTSDIRDKLKGLGKIERAVRSLHNAIVQNYEKIDIIAEKVKLANDEVIDLHKNIKNLHSQSQKTHSEINRLKDDSEKKNNAISSLKVESQQNDAEILTNLESSKSKLQDIEKIYAIAHETGLSGEFEKRRNDHQKEMNNWAWLVFLVSTTLLILIVALFVFQLKMNGMKLDSVLDLNFYIRFLIFSPVVYYLYFVSIQYAYAKKLHDKYAFKTTLAMTIKSHIILLTKDGYFNDSSHDKILDFILDAFRKIYNEPYDTDSYKLKIKLANFEIDMQKKIINKLSSLKPETVNGRKKNQS